MGKEIEKIARSRGHEIVSIIDIDNRQDFASEAFRSADVAIEFTAPSVAYGNCMEAFKNGVKVVSGSTGWMGEHGDEMRRLCQEEGKTLFWSSNFSLGVAIFSAVNKYLARIMNNFPNYEVSMVETHHIHKLDAPSGTAITLAEGILENLDRKDKWVMGTLTAPDGTVSGTTECAPNELPVSAIREGEVPGIHTITYESEADSIVITQASRKQWIKFGVVTVLYLIFLVWLRSWLGLIVLPFIFDAYITHKIPRKGYHGMGGCYCVRTGSCLFRESVLLPELCDTFFFAGEIVVGRRLPVCQQDELRCPYSTDSVAHAAHPAYVAGVQLQVLSGMAGLGLQAGRRTG